MIEELIIGGGIATIGVIAVSTIKIYSKIPYAYSNAKIRALKSELITDDELKKYLHQGYNEIIYDISKKEGFKHFVEITKGDTHIEQAEAALRINQSRIMKKVYKATPDQLKKFVKTILRLYEIKNLQTILRYRKSLNEGNNISPELLKNLMVETKKLTKNNWEQLITMPLKDLVEKFKDEPYYHILKEEIRIRSKRRKEDNNHDRERKGETKEGKKEEKSRNKEEYDFDLEAINKRLDQFYFEELRKNAKEEASKKYSRTVIDNFNIRQSLFKKEFKPFKGGYLEPDFYKGIKKFEELKNKLRNTPYKEAAENATDEETLEQELEKHLKKIGEEFMMKDPLSPYSIIGFIILKLFEIKNLRLILTLKNSGFKPEEITPYLIINT